MVTEEQFNAEFRTIRIIWFALFFSLAVYVLVGLLVGGKGTPLNEQMLMTLRAVFFGLSLVLLFVPRPVRKFILGSKGRTPQQNRAMVQRPEAQRYASAMIVACAMSEAIGIFGLVLYILGKNAADLFVFIAVSAVAMFQYRPKIDELRGMSEGGGPEQGAGM